MAICASVVSQPLNVNPAIDIDHFAGGIGQVALCDGDTDFADVIRLAPALERRQPFRDELVILGCDDAGHIRSDNAGSNLINGDVLPGQAVCIQLRHHAHAGLGDAVFAPADAADIGAHRADVDDL